MTSEETLSALLAKQLKESMQRNAKMANENRLLRERVRELEEKIEKLPGPGETL